MNQTVATEFPVPGEPPSRFFERAGIWALAAATAVSNAGNGITSMAIPWFVLVTTGSAARTGLVGAAISLSTVLAGILGGPVIDRLGFKRASIISDLASGVTVAMIPTLYLLDLLNFWVLMVLAFASALLDVPGAAARRSMLPALSRQSGMPLERANSLMQLANNLSQSFLAPMAGGLLIAALGAANVLFVDAGTFAVSLLIVWLAVQIPARLATPDGAEEAREEEALGLVDNILAGFRFILRDRVLMTMVPAALLMNFLGAGLGGVLLPVYARESFGAPQALGYLFAATGVGAALGALLYGARGHEVRRYSVFLGGFALAAASYWLFVFSPFLVLDIVAMLLMGIAVGPLSALVGVILQKRTPEYLLGRVTSALYTFFSGAAPLGVLIAGVAVDWFGVRSVLISAAVLITLIPTYIALSPSARAAAIEFDAPAA